MTICEKLQQALQPLFPLCDVSSEPLVKDEPQVADSEKEESQTADTPTVGVLWTDAGRYGHHLDIVCLPDQVVPVAGIMDREGFFLEAITGVDWLKRQQLEVVYDYNRLGGEHCRVMVRTFLPRNNPVVPTVSSVFPAADWHERETYDFYGIQFQGHPNLIRILLPEDADFHPLLKDYTP
ncbi:NADH-quinone oxidoreductase subunit C [Desulfobulbus oligotrophicus]|jgi:NADH-quinone oxidoreductase subunit C|uniref:NADH-quinone oxidoreductase subunit C n=1 Tax=Desulfobulbus oligotrophicus TaxID=1909699 RepID=A0A7T5VDG6_9BACT|nr:NADH-quinone oxidoreductase subunit C [Desulfobulbus oligotrophicus]MDY0390431.1 NADH-quinone oxidoreductase subunit C [Desulfobulbus oligotrophicus]QQG65791.1 NADH-quinone oxidoreductase subunit C [Desulfobulbus oligotrophicus]